MTLRRSSPAADKKSGPGLPLGKAGPALEVSGVAYFLLPVLPVVGVALVVEPRGVVEAVLPPSS